MKWLTEPVILEPAVAAAIADDLEIVANADGELHERELALIAAFRDQIPAGTAASADLKEPAVITTYLRSLVLLALADGEITDEEIDQIAALAGARGIPRADVLTQIARLKVRFYGDLSAGELREELREAAVAQGLEIEEAGELWN